MTVLSYQLLFVRGVHQWGFFYHWLFEILFYGVAGPLATWLSLWWIEHIVEERARAQRVARAREKYLAKITSASPDAMISLNQQEIIQSWNRGATSIFGYQPEEIIDRPFDRLVPEEIRQKGGLAKVWARVKEKGLIKDWQTQLLTKEGNRVPVELSCVSLNSKAPGTRALIIRDITDRKKREKAVLKERNRIAREIHDGIIQSLCSLGLKVDFCQKLLEKEPRRVAGQLKVINRNLQANLDELRRIIFNLRSFKLDRGLNSAINSLVAEFEAYSHTRIRVSQEGEIGELPSPVEYALFRVVQEALTNVEKHSGAANVWIEVASSQSGVIQVNIRDDGVGFDPTATDRGMGIKNMRERIEAVGGEFECRSTPEKGTEIRISAPGEAK